MKGYSRLGPKILGRRLLSPFCPAWHLCSYGCHLYPQLHLTSVPVVGVLPRGYLDMAICLGSFGES